MKINILYISTTLQTLIIIGTYSIIRGNVQYCSQFVHKKKKTSRKFTDLI